MTPWRNSNKPQCETAGPLPVLRTPDELPKFAAVLSGGPSSLAQVAQPAHARQEPPVAGVCSPSAAASPVAPPDPSWLGGLAESYLRCALRQLRTGRSVRSGG